VCFRQSIHSLKIYQSVPLLFSNYDRPRANPMTNAKEEERLIRLLWERNWKINVEEKNSVFKQRDSRRRIALIYADKSSPKRQSRKRHDTNESNNIGWYSWNIIVIFRNIVDHLGVEHSWQKSWLFGFLELSFWLFQNANIVKSQKPDFQVSRT